MVKEPIKTDNDYPVGTPSQHDTSTAAGLLHKLAATLAAKNQDYGASYLRLGPMLTAMFPDGFHIREEEQDLNNSEVFMLLRILDKLNRVANLRLKSSREALVDEKVEDTLMDIAGYCALWAEMLKKKRDEPSAYAMLNFPPGSPFRPDFVPNSVDGNDDFNFNDLSTISDKTGRKRRLPSHGSDWLS